MNSLPLITCLGCSVVVFTMISCSSGTSHKVLDSIVVEVTGNEYNWHFRYPGLDGKLGTADDQYSAQNLYLPDNADVTLELKSKDYVYSIAFPDLGLREIAVPGLEFSLQFSTHGESTLLLLGDQFCGYAHDTLIGTVFIRNQSNDGFYEWEKQGS